VSRRRKPARRQPSRVRSPCNRRALLSIFDHELADTAVVSIGRSPARAGFYDRTLYFRRLDQGATLVPLRPRPQPVRSPATRGLVRPIRASA
jgi:hypothetical protein